MVCPVRALGICLRGGVKLCVLHGWEHLSGGTTGAADKSVACINDGSDHRTRPKSCVVVVLKV